MDAHKNFAYTTVSAAPAPQISGGGLAVLSGTASRLPAVPFNAVIWPTSVVATYSNAELVRVTNIVGDTLSITRAQEGTSAISIAAGFQLAATLTNKYLDDIEQALSVVSQALSVETAARVAKDDTLSQGVSVLSQALSALSQAHSVVSTALSNETSARVAKDDTLSQAVSVLSQQVSVLSQAHSVLSQGHSVLSQAHSVLSTLVAGVSARGPGGTSAKGLQSALNALSNTISDALSAGNVASNSLSILSQQVSVLSQAHSAISQQVSALSSQVSVVSVAVTSVDTRLNTVSNQVSINSQQLSVHSQQLSVHSQQLSVQSQQISTISQQVSVLSQAVSVLSQAQSVLSAQTRLTALPADVVVSVSTLTNIAGLSVSVDAGARYRLEGMVAFNHGGAIARFGMTFPAMKMARGRFMIPKTAAGSNQQWGGDSASGSVLMSEGTASLAASAVWYINGILVVSTTGVVQLQAGGSAGTSAVTIKEGSYLAAFKLS